MSELRATTESPEETVRFGARLGRSLIGGLTIGLVGPLGVGKTQLVKGIAVGNAADDARRVTSPTFTLIHEYPGRLVMYHVDAYRLLGGAELAAIGFDELIRPDSVVVVEWADRVRSVMPADTLWIELSPLEEQSRTFVMKAAGGPAAQVLSRLIHEVH